MKNSILLFLLFISCTVHAQVDKDVRAITELLVLSYAEDKVDLFHKFENQVLIKDLESAKSRFDNEFIEGFDSREDSITLEDIFSLDADSLEIDHEGVLITYRSALQQLKKNHRRKLKKFVSGTYIKNKRKRPLAFISSPLFSNDGMSAIVYGSYTCGSLCGSGGIYFFRKEKGVWFYDRYEIRWVS